MNQEQLDHLFEELGNRPMEDLYRRIRSSPVTLHQKNLTLEGFVLGTEFAEKSSVARFVRLAHSAYVNTHKALDVDLREVLRELASSILRERMLRKEVETLQERMKKWESDYRELLLTKEYEKTTFQRKLTRAENLLVKHGLKPKRKKR